MERNYVNQRTEEKNHDLKNAQNGSRNGCSFRS